jgi:hypothetical protein
VLFDAHSHITHLSLIRIGVLIEGAFAIVGIWKWDASIGHDGGGFCFLNGNVVDFRAFDRDVRPSVKEEPSAVDLWRWLVPVSLLALVVVGEVWIDVEEMNLLIAAMFRVSCVDSLSDKLVEIHDQIIDLAAKTFREVYDAIKEKIPAGVVSTPPIVKGGFVAVGYIVVEECGIGRYVEMKVLVNS